MLQMKMCWGTGGRSTESRTRKGEGQRHARCGGSEQASKLADAGRLRLKVRAGFPLGWKDRAMCTTTYSGKDRQRCRGTCTRGGSCGVSCVLSPLIGIAHLMRMLGNSRCDSLTKGAITLSS